MNADKLRESIKFLDECEKTEMLLAANDPTIITLRDLAEQILSTPSELPEKYKNIPLGGNHLEDAYDKGYKEGFNSALDIAEQVVAKKNARIEELTEILKMANILLLQTDIAQEKNDCMVKIQSALGKE